MWLSSISSHRTWHDPVFTQSPYMFPLFSFIFLMNTPGSPGWARLAVEDVSPEGRKTCLCVPFSLSLPRCLRTTLRCKLWPMVSEVSDSGGSGGEFMVGQINLHLDGYEAESSGF